MAAVEEARGQWGSQVEFLLACLGYAVGLGNVWRFPYLCYTNGGGAFLIPYLISLIVAGLPMFFMELSLGQFSSLGPNILFQQMAPVFQGLGWGMIVVSALIALYYNMIIAWVLFYLAESFTTVLPWSTCRNAWNTWQCYSNREDKYCRDYLNDSEAIFHNQTCWTGVQSTLMNLNQTIADFKDNSELRSPADEYFHNHILGISDSFENLGSLSWRLVLCLMAAWFIVFLCLIKGVKSTGKVVYFTATFPYVVLCILLVRGVTLDGAWDGIYFYMVPDFSKLLDRKVWITAATQIFYSLGPASGGLITMSSYNRFNNNCLRDALLVAIGNCATSIFAGFVIFSIVGFVAHDLGVNVANVTDKGPGLAFIVYPEALTRMPIGPLWSILFFVMLVTLGLDSQFVMLETCTTALMDQFTWMRSKKHIVVGTACIVFFLLGLPLCTQGGFYIFTLINDYSAGYCLVILALCEVSVVSFMYGLTKFFKDIETMIGYKPNWYWKICFMVLCPVFLLIVLIFSLADYEKSSYREYEFSGLAEGIGWMMSFLSLACLPAFAIYQLIQFKRMGKPLSDLIKPSDQYCPAEERRRLSQLPHENTKHVMSPLMLPKENGHVARDSIILIQAPGAKDGDFL